MGTTDKILTAALSGIVASSLLTGCFTGVESTPRITYEEVTEKEAEASSPEEALAASFYPESFGDWKPGKQFFVTSGKISLILIAGKPESPMPQHGDTLLFKSSREVAGLTGHHETELIFEPISGNGNRYYYRTEATAAELEARKEIKIPFTIDLKLINDIKNNIVGKSYYIKSSLWLKDDGTSTIGRKFVKVNITDVVPATEIHPCKVVFTDEDGNTNAIYMTVNNGLRRTSREFPALFSQSNPRDGYPQITDQVWNAITHSKLLCGMTKTEAALALGQPRSVDRGHDHSTAYERWAYSDGVYLIFEDGILTKFNQ